jgi:hypothetical protein
VDVLPLSLLLNISWLVKALEAVIQQALLSITAADACSWLTHCG